MSTVEFLNSVVVTKDELWRLSKEAEKVQGSDTASEGMFLIARQYKGQPQKASAIWFRMQALVQFIQTETARGWTLPKGADGAIPTMEAVFAAAAVHPLVQIGNEVMFEHESFSEQVLRLAEAEGQS